MIMKLNDEERKKKEAGLRRRERVKKGKILSYIVYFCVCINIKGVCMILNIHCLV